MGPLPDYVDPTTPQEELQLRALEDGEPVCAGRRARGEGSGVVESAGEGAGEEEQEEPLPVALLPVRLPPPYPQDSASLSLLRIQASNVQQNMDAQRGIKTYKTTWTGYERWHRSATGQPAPVCPLTGLVWLDARQGTHFVTHAAANGMTIHQMSSARSALNWLITQHHTMRRQVNDGEPAPAKLSSKDAVRRRVVAVVG